MIYDRNCGFCRWSLARLLALDRADRVRPLPLSADEADRLLHDLPAHERDASWHLISPDGRRASGGAAVAPLLRLLPGGRIPAAIAARTPRLSDRAYRWVAEHRSQLSRLIPARAKRRADEALGL